MDPHRTTLGRRIKRARQRAGFRSQREFAAAIGVDESSVANAERGHEKVGDYVFGRIEAGLEWPEDSARRYLETGDDSVLPSPTPEPTPQPQGYDMDEIATNALAEMAVLGADAATYNRSLEAWEVILKRSPVEFDQIRREAHRRAAEILARRTPDDNPASATG